MDIGGKKYNFFQKALRIKGKLRDQSHALSTGFFSECKLGNVQRIGGAMGFFGNESFTLDE